MSTQLEALRLADLWEKRSHGYALTPEAKTTAELRRLSEIETLYHAAMRGRHAMSQELLAVTAQRDELLEVAKLTLRMGQYGGVSPRTVEDAAREAIKSVEGESHAKSI